MDAEAAIDERGGSVRQRRVVLTSRCWRQCSWRQQLSGRYGGKTAVLRGEHVISRKAIAQGMSDVLRCPVCSCAHFLCTLRMRPRVQRASGIPCALCFHEGAKITSKPRAQRVARMRTHIGSMKFGIENSRHTDSRLPPPLRGMEPTVRAARIFRFNFQTANVTPHSRGALRPRFSNSFRPLSSQRAQGMPGARCTRGLMCNG